MQKFLVIAPTLVFYINIVSFCQVSNSYAILLNGGDNRDNNDSAYYNDMRSMYSCLVEEYNFYEGNIYVLNADGTNSYADMTGELNYQNSDPDLDDDGDNDIDYSATSSNLLSVLSNLESNLTENDFLYIFITGPDNYGWDWDKIVLWSQATYDKISLWDLNNELDKINAGQIVVVGAISCGYLFHSRLAGENRIIVSATSSISETRQFLNYNGSLGYGAFAYYWIGALRGETDLGTQMDADIDQNGYISMHETFITTNAAYTYNETNQYSSWKYTLGENVTLLGKEICVSTDYYHDVDLWWDDVVTIKDCTIDVKNVTVQDGSSLTLEAENSVIIHSEFHVTTGCTCNILID